MAFRVAKTCINSYYCYQKFLSGNFLSSVTNLPLTCTLLNRPFSDLAFNTDYKNIYPTKLVTERILTVSPQKTLSNNYCQQRYYYIISTTKSNSCTFPPLSLQTNPEEFLKYYSTESGAPELSNKDKIKRAVKEYGITVIVFHVTISLISLGSCYLAVTSGINLGSIINAAGLGGSGEVATEAGLFVVAYAVHKVLAPVRISITLAATPFIVRYLRKINILKAPKQK